MKTSKHLTLTSISIALMVGTTGCTLIGDNAQDENTPTATATVETTAPAKPSETPTAEPTETPTVTTPPAEASPTPEPTGTTTETPTADTARIREGNYYDAWAIAVASHFQNAANQYLSANINRGIQPGALQIYLDGLLKTETQHDFRVTASTTASNNFTIKVWHDKGNEYTSVDSAYVSASDPESTTPTPTEPPSASGPSERLDEDTERLVVSAAGATKQYIHQGDGSVPTDEYMRANGFIPQGWEWSIEQDEFEATYFTIKVWHPQAFLYNSEDTAASYTSYPQPELRPNYNYDVTPYVSFVGVIDLNELLGKKPVPTPTSTPSSSPSPTTNGVQP